MIEACAFESLSTAVRDLLLFGTYNRVRSVVYAAEVDAYGHMDAPLLLPAGSRVKFTLIDDEPDWGPPPRCGSITSYCVRGGA